VWLIYAKEMYRREAYALELDSSCLGFFYSYLEATIAVILASESNWHEMP
jgi:hypothetical protein